MQIFGTYYQHSKEKTFLLHYGNDSIISGEIIMYIHYCQLCAIVRQAALQSLSGEVYPQIRMCVQNLFTVKVALSPNEWSTRLTSASPHLGLPIVTAEAAGDSPRCFLQTGTCALVCSYIPVVRSQIRLPLSSCRISEKPPSQDKDQGQGRGSKHRQSLRACVKPTRLSSLPLSICSC